MYYLIITLVCVLISGYLFKKGCGTISISRLNMMSVIFYYYLLLQCVIGSVLAVNSIDNHYILDKLQYSQSRIYGYWAVMYTIVVFPIGMLIANKLWRIKNIRHIYYSYCDKSIQKERKYNDKAVKVCCIGISAISLIAVLYVTYIIGEISFLKLLGNSHTVDLSLYRAETTREFGGNIYIRNIVAIGFTPLMSYVAYAYKLRNNSYFNKIWFWVMFIASIQIVSYNLEKSPIIVYLLGFLFFRIYTGYIISKKQIIVLGLFFLSLIILMYAALMQEGLDFKTLFAFNTGIVGRLTLSSVAGVFLGFDIWPKSYDYIGFSSLSQLLSDIMGSPYTERSARIIMEITNPHGIEMGTAGVMNTLFIGEAWANWGILGVILSPILVGILIQSLYLFFLKTNKTPFYLALFVNLSFKSAITGGINDYVYNVGIFEYLILILSIYGGSLLLKKSVHHEKKNYISHTVKT